MADVEHRKLSTVALTRRILTQVAAHPNNAGHRGRAVARSLLWQVRKRVATTPFVRPVFARSKVWMDPNAGSTSNLVYFGDRFDLDEMRFLERFLRPGDRVLDVGANVGLYTLFIAELVGPAGSIVAFEPVPDLVAKLRANVELNGLGEVVAVCAAATSDRAGRAAFTTGQDVSNRFARPGESGMRVAEVPVVALDDVVPEPVVLAKVDVEGAETATLRGFRRHLGAPTPPVLLIEVLDHQLTRLGTSAAELVGLLVEHGYLVLRYDPGAGELVQVDGVPRGNVVAVAERSLGVVADRLGPHRPLGP